MTGLAAASGPLGWRAAGREDPRLAEHLRLVVRATATWTHEAVGKGRGLLFEGAQGSMLDVDHGSTPYVSRSNSSTASIEAGSGTLLAGIRMLPLPLSVVPLLASFEFFVPWNENAPNGFNTSPVASMVQPVKV